MINLAEGFKVLMLWRLTANESHVFSFAVIGALVLISWQLKGRTTKPLRAFRYAAMVGAFAIWWHEVVWWTLYWWADLPHMQYWYLAVQMGVGFYFTFRVLPTLLRQKGYRINWRLFAIATVPLLYYMAGWLWLGFGSSVDFYSPATNSILLIGQPSALSTDLLTNTLENLSWLCSAVSALVAVALDGENLIPFTFRSAKRTKSYKSKRKPARIAKINKRPMRNH